MTVAAPTTNEAELSSQRRSFPQSATWDRAGIALSGIAVLVGALVVLYSLIPAIQWYNMPFPGVVTSYSLVVTGTRALTNETWTGTEAGLKINDRIVKLTYDAIDGPVTVTFDGSTDLYNRTLAQLRFGQEITMQVIRPERPKLFQAKCSGYSADSLQCNYTFRVDRVPLGDFLIQYGIGFATACAILIVGGVVWVLRRRDESARLIAAITAMAAYVIVGRFDTIALYQSQVILYWGFAACALGALLASLAMTFPTPLSVVRRRPYLLIVPFVIAAALFVASMVVYQQVNPATYDSVQLIGATVIAIGLLAMIVSMFVRRNRSVSSVVREQAGISLIGAGVAITPLLLWLVTVALERWTNSQNISFSSAFVLPTVTLFPLSLAYAVLAYRRIDSDRIISEALIYGALGVVLVAGYLLVTSAVYVLSNSVIRFDNPLLIAGTLFLIAVMFSPARVRLEGVIDRAFFRQRRIYEGHLERFSRQMALSVDLLEVVQKVKSQLDETLMPQYMFVFLRNSRSGDYESFNDSSLGMARTDVRFEANSTLIRVLESGDPILYLEPGQALPTELISERPRLGVLNAPIILRLRSRNRLNGFLALGPRKDRGRYHAEEFRYLETLSGQAAAAVERAQIILDVQRNESELTVLAQVSAALSIAMDFDTLLEFIYAQVDKLVQAPNFYIALHDERNNELYYVFYQEEGDRISAKEGYRWAVGRDLMSEIFRTKQPIRTDNFVQETQRRDRHLPVENPDLRAWMGVPLNAGEGTILGAMAAASTSPEIHYTDDQVRIFWAIAGLAATALFKTRLFSQTEERARQMKVLNDISSRLAKEFENIEALLKIITESAVEILQAEAGSLLLRDETNGDLIFQLAIGGSGDELVGSRIPAGSGIAGTVVSTSRHVIVNDTQHDKRWFGEVSADAAERNRERNRKFSTRSILAVPLISRGGVIGVIEIINKLNGTGFFDEDAELLTTFAGQAAIAIQNARMFKMTDEALNLRVQQLDNMQRIDQELNRTLDLQRVVDLTIDNSMRESGADVGALALVKNDPPGFEIAGSIGYPEGILSPGDKHPLDLGILGRVYLSKRPAMIVAAEIQSNPDYVEILPGAKGQLAVPLVTGDDVSAVLILESLSGDAFNEVTATFIQGLAEHANTAITNAQLFQRLEIANQSRSQLMGFAAHELKNPMASIKGYSEILLGGMTGKLTEQQQGFIAVIRNNVVRMQQIVDDLKDLTAHETGNLKLNLAPTSFNNVVIETLRPQQRAIDEKEQKVVLNVPENLPPIWGDELRLIQVMTNFVSNANKYTPPGGIITIATEIMQNPEDGNGSDLLHCMIIDTGIGMDEKDLSKLFTAYWRSDNPRAQEQSGTGLGMTLTRGLVEAHGGRVWVESKLNVGTTFHMTIPLVTDKQAAQKPRR